MLRFLKGKKAAGQPVSDAADPGPPARPLATSPGAPLAEWARALEVEPAALSAPEPTLSPGEQRAVEELLEHFHSHPGAATFPSIALRVLDLVRRPDAEVSQLAAVLGEDAAISTGLVALVNTPAFRGLKEIHVLKDAVARLGFAEAARLAAALSMRPLYSHDQRPALELFGANWDRIFFHVVTVARAASELARQRKVGDPEQIFLAALLHDVGKAVALRSLAAKVLDGWVPVTDAVAIERILHHVHVHVGAEVHREWRLPTYLAEAVLHHHDPVLPPEAANAEVHLVRLVSAIDLLRDLPECHPEAPREIADSARALGLGPAAVAALGARVEETGEWVRKVLGGEEPAPPTPD